MNDTLSQPLPPATPPPPIYSPTPGIPRPVARDPLAAVLFELLPGFCVQTFGIGNIYAGNVGIGLALMFGYWFTCLVNFLLCFILIGFLTWPVTWLGFAAGASYLAYHKAKETQRGVS